MKRMISLLVVVLTLLIGSQVWAQEPVWVQIEAQPTEAEGQERARAYAAAFPNAVGFRLNSGWYAVALGPFAPEEAAARLAELRRENLIPRDSFVADGRGFLEQFFPAAGTALTGLDAAAPAPALTAPALTEPAAPAPAEPFTLAPAAEAATVAAPESEPAAEPAPPAEPAVAAAPEALPEETPEQARQSETALSPEGRGALQIALQWFGFYDGKIDGAFGRGTRASMAAWQEANGLEPTGILTGLQRDTLLANHSADIAEYGFDTVTETEAGIEITLPLSLVAFDHYEPPFVHFAERNGSGVRVILISQPGDQAAMYGLYDILQTLEVVPLNGERTRGERGFTLSGRNATIASHSEVTLSQGLIKGYMLIWDPKDDARMERVLQTMQASFRAVGDRALDPGLVPLSGEARSGLLSGLEVRKPRLSRTGFYIDGAGLVLTTSEAVEGCGRVTLDGDLDASVMLSDLLAGLAVLKPATPLSPPDVAAFQLAADRIGAEVAVSGYSYGETLPAPILTFGTLDATEGLDGEPGLKRLSLTALAGDAGGPVLDGTGAVLGMLLPKATTGARVLPEGVAFAASGAAIAARLDAAGITLSQSPGQGALAPEDLSDLATGMTVLVSCWD